VLCYAGGKSSEHGESREEQLALASETAKLEPGAAGSARLGILRRVTPLAGIVAFLLAWQLFVIIWKMPPYLLPSPVAIAQTFVAEFPELLRHGWVTTYEMIAGYALAVAIAIPLAIAITSSARFNQFVMPTMLFFQIVPKVAIAPLFLVWFGVGATPKILVAFLISFFPIVIDAAVGLRSMSTEMADLARSMGATRLQVFTRFRLPTSLPYLFSGLKVAATLAIAGTVVGEFVGADKGLGYLLLVTNSNMQTALMFATIVALTIIGLVFYYLVELLEGLLIPWHVTHRVREESGTM
jgi:NitT/TauT family transport system permease protein